MYRDDPRHRRYHDSGPPPPPMSRAPPTQPALDPRVQRQVDEVIDRDPIERLKADLPEFCSLIASAQAISDDPEPDVKEVLFQIRRMINMLLGANPEDIVPSPEQRSGAERFLYASQAYSESYVREVEAHSQKIRDATARFNRCLKEMENVKERVLSKYDKSLNEFEHTIKSIGRNGGQSRDNEVRDLLVGSLEQERRGHTSRLGPPVRERSSAPATPPPSRVRGYGLNSGVLTQFTPESVERVRRRTPSSRHPNRSRSARSNRHHSVQPAAVPRRRLPVNRRVPMELFSSDEESGEEYEAQLIIDDSGYYSQDDDNAIEEEEQEEQEQEEEQGEEEGLRRAPSVYPRGNLVPEILQAVVSMPNGTAASSALFGSFFSQQNTPLIDRDVDAANGTSVMTSDEARSSGATTPLYQRRLRRRNAASSGEEMKEQESADTQEVMDEEDEEEQEEQEQEE